MTDRELLNQAKEAQAKAYSRYSGVSVGAAIECADGTVYTGCNVENASSCDNLCAERVAVAKAVSEGHRDFRRLAVVVDSPDYRLPCGSCRQVLVEFAPDLEVLCAKASGAYVSYKLRDLLPLAFRL